MSFSSIPSFAAPVLASALVLVACGGGTPAPDTPDTSDADVDVDAGDDGPAEPESVETGKDCATAEAVCEGGVCTVTLKNDCAEPVTCEMKMLALCRSETDVGEAKGVGRDTFAAGVTGELQAGADCQGRQVAATQMDGMSCN